MSKWKVRRSNILIHSAHHQTHNSFLRHVLTDRRGQHADVMSELFFIVIPLFWILAQYRLRYNTLMSELACLSSRVYTCIINRWEGMARLIAVIVILQRLMAMHDQICLVVCKKGYFTHKTDNQHFPCEAVQPQGPNRHTAGPTRPSVKTTILNIPFFKISILKLMYYVALICCFPEYFYN